ncbi:MAG: hypothetical protein AAFV53_11635, partial [Myxococcota bacterium]
MWRDQLPPLDTLSIENLKTIDDLDGLAQHASLSTLTLHGRFPWPCEGLVERLRVMPNLDRLELSASAPTLLPNDLWALTGIHEFVLRGFALSARDFVAPPPDHLDGLWLPPAQIAMLPASWKPRAAPLAPREVWLTSNTRMYSAIRGLRTIMGLPQADARSIVHAGLPRLIARTESFHQADTLRNRFDQLNATVELR